MLTDVNRWKTTPETDSINMIFSEFRLQSHVARESKDPVLSHS